MQKLYIILIAVLVLVCLAIGWQVYLIDFDWDAAEYVAAVRDGSWFVTLGYGRPGYLFLMRPAGWISAFLSGEADFNSVYWVMKGIHVGFSLLLIVLWVLVGRKLFSLEVTALGSPLLLLNVPFATYTSRIWTEIPMLVLVYGALLVWAGLFTEETKGKSRALGYGACGALMAAAILIREIAVFFLPAFFVPLLVKPERRREAAFAAAALAGACAVAFLAFYFLRRFSPTYDSSVRMIQKLFPVSLAPEDVGQRAVLLGRTLLWYYVPLLAGFALGTWRLIAIRRWDLLAFLVCVALVPLSWTVVRGDFYERYVLPAVPGLALGSLPAIEAVAHGRGIRWRMALFAALTGVLLLTLNWREVGVLKANARETRERIQVWTAIAMRSTREAQWVVGSYTAIFGARMQDLLARHWNRVVWPTWEGTYDRARESLKRSVDSGDIVFVFREEKSYTPAQWAFVQWLENGRSTRPRDKETGLYEIHPGPESRAQVVISLSEQEARDVLRRGFGPVETWSNSIRASWIHDRQATVTLPVEYLPRVPGMEGLLIRLELYIPALPGGDPQGLTIVARSGSRTHEERLTLAEGAHEIILKLERDEDSRDYVSLELSFDGLWVPARTESTETDTRPLAAALSRIVIENY